MISERINEFLNLINVLWGKKPDLRFNQLIYILQNGYSKKNGNVGKIESVEVDGFKQIGFDLFNTEDDKFLEYLKNEVQQGTE